MIKCTSLTPIVFWVPKQYIKYYLNWYLLNTHALVSMAISKCSVHLHMLSAPVSTHNSHHCSCIYCSRSSTQCIKQSHHLMQVQYAISQWTSGQLVKGSQMVFLSDEDLLVPLVFTHSYSEQHKLHGTTVSIHSSHPSSPCPPHLYSKELQSRIG